VTPGGSTIARLNPLVLRTVAFTLSAAAAGLAGALFRTVDDVRQSECFSLCSIDFCFSSCHHRRSGGGVRTLIGSALIVPPPRVPIQPGKYRLLFFGALLLESFGWLQEVWLVR